MKWLMVFAFFILPARAEKLITSLSTHRVIIQSNFTGGELVLFGLIERDGLTVGRNSGYDVIITVRGEEKATLIRQKERVMGLYLNQGQRILPESPLMQLSISNRKFAEIVEGDVGLEMILPELKNDIFRNALISSRKELGLYKEIPNGVTFVTQSLFRARIPIAANVAVGQYSVDTQLYSGGVVISKNSTNFEIVKSGIESFVSQQARENSFIYGLFIVFISIFSGFLAHLIFRRD